MVSFGYRMYSKHEISVFRGCNLLFESLEFRTFKTSWRNYFSAVLKHVGVDVSIKFGHLNLKAFRVRCPILARIDLEGVFLSSYKFYAGCHQPVISGIFVTVSVSRAIFFIMELPGTLVIVRIYDRKVVKFCLR